MDNYTLFLLKTDRKFNITQLIGSLNWSDNIDTLGTQLTFDIARNRDDLSLKNYDLVEIGDKLILKNNSKEIFRGVITDVAWNKYSKGIVAFDYAIYLNKSKTIKQFKNIQASEAIRQLCGVFKIPIGNIDTITTPISKIYKDKTIAEIIKDILSQAENELDIKYRLEMREGKIYIKKYVDLEVDPIFKTKSQQFKILNTIGNINKSESIQEMKNSVLVSSKDEEDTRVVESVKDEVNIAKYGLLQEVLSVQDKDESQTNNIAKNKLKELNRIQEDISLDLLGSDLLRAGRIIPLNNDNFDLKGRYLIKSSNHSYSNSIHKTSITIKGVE